MILRVNCWKNIYSCSVLVFRSLNDNASIIWLLSSLCKNYVLRAPFSEHLYYIQMHCYLELSVQQEKRCQKFVGCSQPDLDSKICPSWSLQNDPLFNLPVVFGHSPFISLNRDIVHIPLTHPVSCLVLLVLHQQREVCCLGDSIRCLVLLKYALGPCHL